MATPYGQGAAIGQRRHRCVFEISFQKLVMHGIALIAWKDPVRQARELRRPVEVLGVCAEDDLLAPPPAEEPERSGADGMGTEGLALSLDHVFRHDLGVPDGDDRDERRVGLAERHLHRVTIEHGEA